ncbi:hypothetical protein [Candidatus Nitrosopumilus sediminis]|uniref:Nitrosopumilus output domain-containing protein n=1 Tax=Candidatus Nitrosopumilus sediminis TaxID=1229909 RepID=K0BBY8_9ARCH|nr:hypothetical protein [Candidatus Nitrosopumilus sediminis]AFS82964.1 hypothetical protein NSED_05810 [Candidatus Nitrosopumilus sediminis]
MAFKVQYRFKEDDKVYTCFLTFEQYMNFKKLPIIQECIVLKKNQKADYEEYMKEMQKAINLLAKNDTSHIHNLSE